MKDGYNISEAARLLNVSRPAIYRYIERVPGRYNVTDEKGKPYITFHGLGLLGEEMRTAKVNDKNVMNVTQTIHDGNDTIGVASGVDYAGVKVSEHYNALKTESVTLQAKLDGANAVIQAQREQIRTLETALAFAQSQVPIRLTGRVDSLWTRLFRRGHRVTNITSEV